MTDEELYHELMTDSPPDAVKRLHNALAARERAVFEKIAQKAFDQSRNYIGRDFGKGDVLSNFARWCLQQAEAGG